MITVFVIWIIGALFLVLISWFFGGIWGESNIPWLKCAGWPIYIIYRIFKDKSWKNR